MKSANYRVIRVGGKKKNPSKKGTLYPTKDAKKDERGNQITGGKASSSTPVNIKQKYKDGSRSVKKSIKKYKGEASKMKYNTGTNAVSYKKGTSSTKKGAKVTPRSVKTFKAKKV